MKITEQDLRERYESLETEQLIELQTRGGLTEIATRVLEQVLAERAVSTEERVAVAVEVKKRLDTRTAMMAALASREARLGAQVFDFVVSGAMWFLILPLSLVAKSLAILGVILSFAYLLLADGLPRGQSLGKRVFGIAVVDRRTHKPCTYGASFVRNLLLVLLGIIDWVFIFGPTRQRLGDWVAGTVVVRLTHATERALEW